MAAIASVIRNRLAAGGYGRTPSEIVHAPYQFEAWHPPGGPGPATTSKPSDAAYRQAAALAQGVFRGVIQDQTGGATHFFASPRKDRLVSSMPLIENADGAARLIAAILAAVAAGELTPTEASEIARLVEVFAKTLELSEFEVRLVALEQAEEKTR